MRGRRIHVRGGGIAALTAAKLLLRLGAEVRVGPLPPRGKRIVAVSLETLALAIDLFGIDRDALRIGPVVRERRVDWSVDGPATMPQLALVCDAADLAAVLARTLPEGVFGEDDGDADWIVDAGGRPDGEGAGERVGLFARVEGVETATSITATCDGWMFTAPHPEGGVAVLLVAPSAASMDVTRIGRPVIDIGRVEPVAPRLASTLCAANRIAAGDAALTLDPLRGDGTGFALRGALLAQAVIAAIDEPRSVAHYEKRIRSVFLAHLRGCIGHYRAARHREIWEREIVAMENVAARLDRGPETFELRLEGFDLVPAHAEGGHDGQHDSR
jgi:hypothetical protein